MIHQEISIKYFSSSSHLSTSLEMVIRLTHMPHNDFVRLSKEKKRLTTPHKYNIKISHEGHQELDLTY